MSAEVRNLELMVNELSDMIQPGPTNPYGRKIRLRDDTPDGLARCIVEYLKFLGHQAEPTDDRMDVVCSAAVYASIGGRRVIIEIDTGDAWQRPEQQAYRNEIEHTGGLYYVAHDFKTFAAWYGQTFAR